jgi:hypothetical protein
VYCRLGSLLLCISILHTAEVTNFLLYVKSRQGQTDGDLIVQKLHHLG